MPNSPGSSPASAPFRLEWRPSRWPSLALLALAPLAAACVLASGVPLRAGAALAGIALAWGLWQAWAQRRQSRHLLVLDADGGALFDGVRVQAWQVRWRGPLAVVELVDDDGRRWRLAWWPDTLPPVARRELRLATRRGRASLYTSPVAP